MKNLPNKPSELLTLALEDLKKCEESPKFVIDMSIWMNQQEEGPCKVCLAGALMAQTLEIESEGITLPCDTMPLAPNENYFKKSLKLHALDAMRLGLWEIGIRRVVESPSKEEDIKAATEKLCKNVSTLNYNENPHAWRLNMEKAIPIMKSFGL